MLKRGEFTSAGPQSARRRRRRRGEDDLRGYAGGSPPGPPDGAALLHARPLFLDNRLKDSESVPRPVQAAAGTGRTARVAERPEHIHAHRETESM
jgi:hypothetical protein